MPSSDELGNTLPELDAALIEARVDAGLEGDAVGDDAVDGDTIVLAGAYAGEAIRREVGGEWRYAPLAPMMQPIFLAAGPDQGTTVNPLGKVIKLLTSGPEDSLAFLAQTVVRVVREPRAAEVSRR